MTAEAPPIVIRRRRRHLSGLLALIAFIFALGTTKAVIEREMTWQDRMDRWRQRWHTELRCHSMRCPHWPQLRQLPGYPGDPP